MNTIWFYWDGRISESRMRILRDSVYSTRVFNHNHTIYIVTNTLNEEDFDGKYDIKIKRWDESIFDETPISAEKIRKYVKTSPRDFSDLFRLVLLYRFGGSYVDTDDLCIAPISKTRNIVCRSYDPHTSFYNNIKDEQCVSGSIREIGGYDHINMFPRNDCWQNWNEKHPFIYDILTNERFQNDDEITNITGDYSWQSITNETCIKWLGTHNIDWNFRLTLLYFFEDFVAHSSYWDRCDGGGEMCDVWRNLPKINEYKWGEYKCNKEVAIELYNKIVELYPSVSHLWLHSKDAKKEWLEDIDESKSYSPSTWILNEVREKIKAW